MRRGHTLLSLTLAAVGCSSSDVGDVSATSDTSASSEGATMSDDGDEATTGDGDGTTTTGDGDGTTTTGDGDGTTTAGDGDGSSGDGDGDGTSGDGDGSSGDGTTGDGDGTTAGDGDGDGTTSGDGDGDGTTSGDGDGDGTTSGDGDGDGTTSGDGDGTTSGDGDGDGTTSGDGDGTTSGDGDGTTSGDGDGDGTTSGDGDGDGDGDGTTSGDGDGDGTTSGDGDGDGTTSGDGDGDGFCMTAGAVAVERPVDLIFVIDNGGSMSDEVAEVEAELNLTLAPGLASIDYRVIMLSRFGDAASADVCVSAPLGGVADSNADGRCDVVPASPINGARFFHHSSVIASHDSLCRLLTDFSVSDAYGLQPGGFQDVLRSGSFKMFVAVTDDGVNCSTYDDLNSVAAGATAAAAWDADLLALSPAHFGTSSARTYSFHSLIGLEERNAITQELWPASDPSTTAQCTPGSIDPGTGYQSLSKLTAGWRLPICSLDYTLLFDQLVTDATSAATVPCSYDHPTFGTGGPVPTGDLSVEVDSATLTATLSAVLNAAACTADGYYAESGSIVLCPVACAAVTSDPGATVEMTYCA